jgi:RNA polymerase sigma-70 factor (ECF subfamily)
MSMISAFGKTKLRDRNMEMDWDVLFRENVGPIYNFFRYRVGNDQVAEDLTANTFEKAWRKRKQFQGEDEGAVFAHWLYSIARNVANDYFRKSPSLVALDSIVEQVDGNSVAGEVSQRLEFARLVRFINQLPDRERDIISLKYGANLNNRQIACQMQLSESNVGTILHRTIQRLRRQMEDHS